MDFTRWTYATEVTDIGAAHRDSGLVRRLITDGDPLSARTETENRVEFIRKDATIGHHSLGSLTCDGQDFIVEMDLEQTEDGSTVFWRHRHERSPRDMV